MTETRQRASMPLPLAITDGETLGQGYVSTWAGATHVVASDAGIREIHLPSWHGAPPAGTDPPRITITTDATSAARSHLASALQQLADYFGGERHEFTVALDTQGPAFHRATWDAVARVPYGATRSYLDIARELGNPDATRAVGMANGANPLAPIIPCHRIVGSDGRLTGYGPGMPLKRLLLTMEGAMPASASDADYAAWLTRLPAGALLGLRATKTLCRPTCARARRYVDRCPRIFTAGEEGVAAGFTPCALCQPTTPALVGLA